MGHEEIISLTEFKSDASGWIKRLQKQPPVVLTQNGRGSAVVAGSVFGGLDTPLGPVFLGFGRNSSGADSWYLSFGSMLRQEPR